MKVFVKNKGLEVTLNKNDFLAKGGEGEIYAKGNVVYKICEPGKMIPEGKFAELAVMTDPHIIKPQDILVDAKGQLVGYTMKYIKDTVTLCQMMTKAFCTKNHLEPDKKLALIRQMQEVIWKHVHPHKILIVDLNELNFLASMNFEDAWFIDVNSYQTPNYPATAIMDSIRDRHCKDNQFNQNTDWFSFGIIAFQMLVGMHPFKGRHPKVSSIKNALDERMKLNLSILNPDATYPKAACYPFSVIPPVYMKWFEAIFEKGQRLPPPENLVEMVKIVQTIRHIVGSNSFDIVELHDFKDEILKYFYSFGKEVVVTEKALFIDNKQVSAPKIKHVAFTAKMNKPIGAYLEGRKVKLIDLYNGQDVPITLEASNIMDYDGRIYIQNGTNIHEITLNEFGYNSLLAASQIVGTCMEQSTKFFEGVVIQNLFGSYHASIFPATKKCHDVALSEFNGHTIVDAKFQRNVLVVVGVDKQGQYNQVIYRFDEDMNIKTMKIDKDITFTGINFTVLESGTSIFMTEDEKLLMFRNEANSMTLKDIDDPAIESDMRLTHKGSTALVMKDNKLYSITMKKP